MEANGLAAKRATESGGGGRTDMPARETAVGAVVIDPDPFRGLLLAGWLAARHDLETLAVAHTLADATTASTVVRPSLVVLSPDLPDGDGMKLLQGGLAARATAILVDRPRDIAARRHADGMQVAVFDRAGGVDTLCGDLDRFVASAGLDTPAVLVEKRLSPRERDVLMLMGLGLQSTTIAARLGMSRLTVETHRKSIARKLGVTGAGLVRRAALHLATGQRAVTPSK